MFELEAESPNPIDEPKPPKVIWKYAGFVLIAIFLFWVSEFFLTYEEAMDSIDTFIPLGFVLVPVELSNPETLREFGQKTALVDLWDGEGLLVFRNLRILQAPHSDQHFAVLIQEKWSREVTPQKGPYRVVLRNPEKPTAKATLSRKRPRIQYGF